MKARTVYESVNFERGRDPKNSMGIGRRREYTDRDLETGDIVGAWSIGEDKEILVQVIGDKIYSGWSKFDGAYIETKVKVLDPDNYKYALMGDNYGYEIIRMDETENFWYMVE